MWHKKGILSDLLLEFFIDSVNCISLIFKLYFYNFYNWPMQQGRMWHKKGILWDLLLEWEEKQNLRSKNFNISRQSILHKSRATFSEI